MHLYILEMACMAGVFILNGSQNNLRLHLSMDEENLIRRLAESAYPRDARLLLNILHKYSMPKA